MSSTPHGGGPTPHGSGQGRVSRKKHSSRNVRRKASKDFDDRWGDEEEAEEENEKDFAQSPPKRVRLENGSASPPMAGSDLDEASKARREEEKDLAERDEFARRLQQKDAEKARKLVEDRSSKTKEGQEAAKRRALAEDIVAREAAMDDLRIRSRQEYLKKREAQELALLRKQVSEETEELRTNPDLSKREKEEFAQNRRVLEIAEERLRIDPGTDGYMVSRTR